MDLFVHRELNEKKNKSIDEKETNINGFNRP